MFTFLSIVALVATLPPNQLLASTDAALKIQNVLFVDTRTPEEFQAGHIPGAAYIDPQTLSETRGDVQGLLKNPDQLATLFAQAGLDPAKHIVAYGANKSAADIKSPARLFWALDYLSFPQVSILDGGYAKWTGERRPVETGASKTAPIPAGQIPVKARPEVLATGSDVIKIERTHEGALVDMRSPEEYAGISKKDFIKKSGHIPGAQNVPTPDLLQGPYFTFKSGADLQKLLAADGVQGGSKVVTYCNTGRDAATGYFAYKLNGFDKVSVYDGSMSEWSQRPSVEVSGK